MATIGLPKSESFMPVARQSPRAPAMLRPWVEVRERSAGMTFIQEVDRDYDTDITLVLYPPLDGRSKSALRGFREGAHSTCYPIKEAHPYYRWVSPFPKTQERFHPVSKGGQSDGPFSSLPKKKAKT